MFTSLYGPKYFAAFTAGMVLLYAMAFVLGVRLKYFLSEQRVERYLMGKPGLLGNFVAAVLGAVTPFCSCTTIPIFSGMLESKVGLSTAMSFLIASPTINPPGLILLWTLFGGRMTVIYVGAVFFAAILGGRVFGQRSLSRYVHEIFLLDGVEGKPRWKDTFAGLWGFLKAFAGIIVLAGLLATLLKSWTPSEATIEKLASFGFAAVPLVVVLGILVYGDFILLIPIAHTLIQKGIPTGTVFAFVMAASGVGIPALLLLSKILHKKLILYYVGILAGLLIFLGYTLNLVMSSS
jgi:uncharacterized membrane protein YraQ (UPF0718 family)